jgi:hypothetical protein
MPITQFWQNYDMRLGGLPSDQFFSLRLSINGLIWESYTMTDRHDPIEREAHQLTRMLDSGRQTDDVMHALRADSYNMNPRDFNRMVNMMRNCDNKDMGDNLEIDRAGNLIIDNGRNGFVVATRDHDQRVAEEQRRHDGYGRWDERYDPRYGRNGGRNERDAVTDGVVNGAIGAATGAAIDGRKGAIAGAAGGIGNVIVDRAGGPSNRDDVTDVVVKGAIGAGVGAVIDGKRGAIAGGAGSVGANIIDKIFNKRHD